MEQKISNEDLLIIRHTGEENHKLYQGAVIPPIYMTSLFVFDSVEENENRSADDYVYSRCSNPNYEVVEKKIAALEHGSKALVFASGMAATSSAIMATCKAGSHIICIRNAYGPVKSFINDYCIPKLNMSVTYIKGIETAEFENAIKPETALIILESPSTFVFSLSNLREVSALARKHGIKTYIDNSYCTPLYQKPLDMGIDIVMHTATKYLGGHSDVMGGFLVSNDTELMKIMQTQIREQFGGVIGPMESWLILRGMRTLPTRLAAHEATATKIAEFLENHTKIKNVYYPGIKSHPQYELMLKQQNGNCGLLSFETADGPSAVKIVNSLRHFSIGCSWGGFESLAVPVMHHASKEDCALMGANEGLIRMHCGLEGVDNLLEDIDNALKNYINLFMMISVNVERRKNNVVQQKLFARAVSKPD